MSVFIERPASVQKRIAVSRSRMYALIAQGKFPKQIVLGPKSVGFMSDEVDAWIEERRRERDTQRGADIYREKSKAMSEVRAKTKV